MTRLAVHVTPRAGRDEVVGWRGDELQVRVRVPAEGGKANAAVCELIATALGVPKRSVRVARGTISRHKALEIDLEDDALIVEVFGAPDPGLFT
jgi:hypothetical protein